MPQSRLLVPLQLYVGRGVHGWVGEKGGRQAGRLARRRRQVTVQRGSEQTTGLADPALAGACVLSAVFPRIECDTIKNENEHLIR